MFSCFVGQLIHHNVPAAESEASMCGVTSLDMKKNSKLSSFSSLFRNVTRRGEEYLQK